MRRLAAVLLLLVPGVGRSQPPLPPTAQPKKLGTVAAVAGTETIALTNGVSAPLAQPLKLSGVGTLAELMAGDVVELRQDANGVVTEITVLPRLVQRKSLLEVLAGNPPVVRFWWTHQGRDFPDSLTTAGAALPLRERCVAFEATAAHVAPASAPPVTFAVIGDGGAPLWQQALRPGETAAVKCALGQAPKVELRCRRADGTPPGPSTCIWGSPTVVLQEPGMVAWGPEVGENLAARLSEALKSVAPGKIAVARPTIIGLSPDMARDLQEDLFTALGHRFKVAGMLALDARPELSEAVRAAAKAVGATSVLTSELRYAPDGARVELSLVDVQANESLAHVPMSLKP